MNEAIIGTGGVEVPNKKWSCDYPGFESIMDFVGDMHIEDALEAIVPDSEWLGTIRITFEYIPSQEERDKQ